MYHEAGEFRRGDWIGTERKVVWHLLRCTHLCSKVASCRSGSFRMLAGTLHSREGTAERCDVETV